MTPAIRLALILPVTSCFSPNAPVASGEEESSIAESTTATSASGNADESTGQGMDATTSIGTSEGDSSDGSSTTGGTSCGDAVIGIGEVCDDGVNDGSYGGCDPGCGSRGPRCGDRVTQRPEDCDDGNQVNGDGCNNDCVESGSTLWTRTHDGDAHEDDIAFGVAIGPDDAVVVVGEEASEAEDTAAWARSYTPDGDEAWTWSVGSLAGAVTAAAVAVDADGAAYVCGRNVAAATGTLWIRRIDLDGTAAWTHTYDSPATGTDACSGAAVDPGGTAVAAGYHATASDGLDIWVRRIDGVAGAELWTRTFDHDSGPDVAADVEYSPAGDIVIGGRQGVAGGTEGWLRKYRADGSIDWTAIHEGGAFAGVYGVDVDAAENVFAVGYESGTPEQVWRIWLAKYDGNGDLLWTVDEDFGTVDAGYGVAVDGAGAVTIAATAADGQYEAWVAKYGPEGDLLWSAFPHAEIAEVSQSFAFGVAVDSRDNVIVVGAERRESEGQTNIWLQKFAP